MPAIEDTALILLAAGLSTRFEGPDSKLDTVWRGSPIGLHAARTLAPLPFARRIAVTGRARLDYSAHGFDTVTNPEPARGLAGSVRLGAARAIRAGAGAALIVLADMPCVTAAHVAALFDGDPPVATTDGAVAMPPALFGERELATLATLADDAGGARGLLRGARRVAAPVAELVDIDTLADLHALRG